MASISRPHIIVFLVSALLLLLYMRFPAPHPLTTDTTDRIAPLHPAPHDPTMDRTNRTAPLHHCDLPAADLVPDSYVVYLWPGATLAQHKAALPGVDLDRAIKHVMGPVLKDGGLLYLATLDQRALDAVRRDGELHVQFVECNGRVRLSADL